MLYMYLVSTMNQTFRTDNVPKDERLDTARGGVEDGDVDERPIEHGGVGVVPDGGEDEPEIRELALGYRGVYDEVVRGRDKGRDRRDVGIRQQTAWGGGGGLDELEVARNDLGERRACAGLNRERGAEQNKVGKVSEVHCGCVGCYSMQDMQSSYAPPAPSTGIESRFLNVGNGH